MRKATTFSILLLLGFCIVFPSLSQEQPNQTSTEPQVASPGGQKMTVAKASQFIGSTVKDPQGQILGEVQDAVIDLQTLQPTYLIVSSGGFWGIGDRLTALPISAFQFTGQNKTIMANIDKRTFQSAPAFSKDDWPPGTKLSWNQEIHSFYGVQPWQQQTTSAK